jgi:hypothetical protein
MHAKSMNMLITCTHFDMYGKHVPNRIAAKSSNRFAKRATIETDSIIHTKTDNG